MELTAYFTKTSIAFVFYLSMLYSGCFLAMLLKENWPTLLTHAAHTASFGQSSYSADRAAVVVEEKHVSSRGIRTDVRLTSQKIPPSPEVSSTRDSKAKEPIT